MLELYKNIKLYRKKCGMTQDELAKRAGYTDRSSIAKIERGAVDLSQSKIMQFAEIFGISPGELMGWEDEEKPTEQSDGLSDNMRKLTDFVKTVPEDKAELVLKVIRSIVEDD